MTITPHENLETETVVLIPVDQCHKSPSQPRKRGGDKIPDDDFVASIREQGVIQPIVVRVRSASGWEVVFGHRRWEGSKLAGKETIPAIVRELTDEQVFELQLIENIHRQDMHPLDEADGFRRMIDKGKKTIAEVAAAIGRPVPYVAQRLKLCELGKEVREAIDKETISMGVAVYLARIPAQLQKEALGIVAKHYEGDSLTSVAEAKKELEGRYLLRLDHAPFDITSVDLVPKAGACPACPKRTGAQRELFPDAARADMCTDPVCYRGKLDALWVIRKKEAKAGGAQVLEGKEAQKELSYSQTFTRLDETRWMGSSQKSVRSLFGEDLPPITLARDERNGEVIELVKSADVQKVIRKSQPKGGSGGGDDSYKARQRAEDAKNRRRAQAVDLAVTEATGRADRIGAVELVRLLTETLIGAAGHEERIAIMRRRDLVSDPKKMWDGDKKLAAHLRAMTNPGDVAGLAIELVLRENAPARYNPAGAAFGATLKTLGVNFAAIEKKVVAEAKAKKKAKAPAKKRAAA